VLPQKVPEEENQHSGEGNEPDADDSWQPPIIEFATHEAFPVRANRPGLSSIKIKRFASGT
jgi:hypothetical protein